MERYLPYLILLICPLMHIFMMRGMHGNKENHCRQKEEKSYVEDRFKASSP